MSFFFCTILDIFYHAYRSSQMVNNRHFSDMNGPTFAEFISVNRFFKDALENKDLRTFAQVAEFLMVGERFLRELLVSYAFPRRMSELRKLLEAATRTTLPAAPPVYEAYMRCERDGTYLTDQDLELLVPVTPYHFDFTSIVPRKFMIMDRHRYDVLTSRWFRNKDPFDTNWDAQYFDSEESRQFRQTMIDRAGHLPDCIRSLDNDQMFSCNADLAVAFLHGAVSFPIPGIASPHLTGTFLLGLRREGTGYLSLNSTRSSSMVGQERWNVLLRWFQENNELYSNCTPVTSANVDIRLDPMISTGEVMAVEVPGANQNLTNERQDVYLTIRQPDGSTRRKYVPLELALALTFPLLFPFGVPKIPAQTLRDKAQLLLASHPHYRCGRLQCHLALFLYHLIQDYNLSFARSQLSIQRINVPNGTNRLLDSPVFACDPSSPTYWRARQSEVRAMCRHFGDPDLMLTLTFVNHWPEIDSITGSIEDATGKRLDMRFCPLEELMVWRSRFKDVKKQKFNLLTTAMGFGPVKHYCWRLEFQARGAPHIHALLWLETRLSIQTLQGIMFGNMPPDSSPNLRSLVVHNMTHNCNIWRCKRGDATQNCRYGFPQPVCARIHVSDEGKIIYPRSHTDRWIVDYSPALLFKWAGHAHVHILRTCERPDCSPNAIHYIVKYNFKDEPSFRVELGQSDSYETLFHARVVSSEEAMARIFSLHFHRSDSSFGYISLHPPETRSAAFVSGVQVQVPVLEKYFLRPVCLEQLPILAFFSLYKVKPADETNEQRLARLQDVPDFSSRQRPPNTLVNHRWEEENLPPLQLVPFAEMFPSRDLPHARALNCQLRNVPKIILTEKFAFTGDPESFCYAFLLLHGCWRSDTEIQATCNSWLAALQYHGLSLPELPEISIYQCRLIDYMLESPRYSAYDIACSVSRLLPDARAYLSNLSDSAPPPTQRLIAEIQAFLNVDLQLPDTVTLRGPQNMDVARQYISCGFSEHDKSVAAEILNERLPKLNDDQRSVYAHVHGALTANVAFRIFVNGRAGTGKSFVISCLQALFTRMDIPFVTCASTGIAASLINGQTLHSTFGLFTDRDGITHCSLDIGRPRGYAISLCKVILIDEITMISRSVLEALDAGLRRLAAQVRHDAGDLAFGGQSVIFFGDVAQVPAVVRAQDDFSESAEQFFQAALYQSFSRFTLRTVMRQDPGELQFMALLEDIRANDILSRESIDLIRTRFLSGPLEEVLPQIDDFLGYDNPSGMAITFKNERANYYNNLILARRCEAHNLTSVSLQAKFIVQNCPGFQVQNPRGHSLFLSAQLDTIRPCLATQQQIRVLFAAFRRHQFNTIIPLTLTIAKGARVMLLQNLDVGNGLINGARGTVIQYLPNQDAIEVKFDSSHPDSPPTIITRTTSTAYQLSHGTQICIYQFPLKLCWAVTAHKSQGQSLARVAIDISEPAFAHGSLYVALSRVRCLDAVRLFGCTDFPDNGPFFHINRYIMAQDADQGLNEF